MSSQLLLCCLTCLSMASLAAGCGSSTTSDAGASAHDTAVATGGTGGTGATSTVDGGTVDGGNGGSPGADARDNTDVCQFVMSNPPASGLPNPASYNTGVTDLVADNVTGLMWERNVSTPTYTRTDATAYCKANTLGGHSDWRLPTVLELASILDFTVSTPSIDPSVFPSTPSGFFWTSTSWGGSSTIGWVVDFGIGGSISKYSTDTYQVRCVRPTGSPPFRCSPKASRYQVAAGYVTDATTGLTWEQAAPARNMNWSAAKAYCAGLGGGFRLPSLRRRT